MKKQPKQSDSIEETKKIVEISLKLDREKLNRVIGYAECLSSESKFKRQQHSKLKAG